jgi:hypothetical protein
VRSPETVARGRVPGRGAAEAEDGGKVEDKAKARAADRAEVSAGHRMRRVSADGSPAPGPMPPAIPGKDGLSWEPRTVRVIRFLLMMGTMRAW